MNFTSAQYRSLTDLSRELAEPAQPREGEFVWYHRPSSWSYPDAGPVLARVHEVRDESTGLLSLVCLDPCRGYGPDTRFESHVLPTEAGKLAGWSRSQEMGG